MNTDVLRATAPRDRLKEWIADVDRLILLGDMLEFRHSPQRDALRQGLPVIQDLADALPKGADIVVVRATTTGRCWSAGTPTASRAMRRRRR